MSAADGRSAAPMSYVAVQGIWRGRGTIKLIWRSAAWRADRPKFQGRFKRRNPVDHKRFRVGPMEVWW